jgi:type II secretory ATPase GspE/PulE/Tfp pilus assembly ATPase PilB-like protein
MFSSLAKNKTVNPELTAFVNNVLEQAFYDNVSEIHLTPGRYDTQVHRQVDGILSPVFFLPQKFHEPAIAYFKNAGERFKVALPQNNIVCRVAFVLTEYGEEAVLKLTEEAPVVKALPALGVLNRGGMILIIGPAGSGKTSMLYSLLAALNTPARNVCLLSEITRLEPMLAGVNHSYFNPAKGYFSANSLRAILRQMPDVVAIDELADRETADIALQAALKKMPIIATLQADNPDAAREQLSHWGFSDATVASAVREIISREPHS